MAATFAEACASPVPLRIGKGECVEMHPLTLADIGTLEGWMATKREGEETSLISKEGIGLIQTVEGMAHAAWLSLRHSREALTLDETIPLFSDLAELSTFVGMLYAVSGFVERDADTKKLIAAAMQSPAAPPRLSS